MKTKNLIRVFFISCMLLIVLLSCNDDPDLDSENDPVQEVPDGSGGGIIAFETAYDSNFEVCLINADGTTETRITHNTAYNGMPNISPDGSKIIFNSDRDGNFEIYIMDINGGNVSRLTNNSNYDFAPKWSPDGTKILFCSDLTGNKNIYVMDNDGSNLVQLTDDPADDIRPEWSPDGTQIAFSSERNGSREIYIMNSDGTNQVQITELGFISYNVDWSPNGEQLAFMTNSFTSGGNYHISIIDIDGNNLQRLTTSGNNESPEWSPDGTKIAFTYSYQGIYIINIDGSDKKLLLNGDHPYPHDWKVIN